VDTLNISQSEETPRRRAVSEETRKKMAQAAAQRWAAKDERRKQSGRSKRFLDRNPTVAEARRKFMKEVVQPLSPMSQPGANRNN
jgi:hypothetical protein